MKKILLLYITASVLMVSCTYRTENSQLKDFPHPGQKAADSALFSAEKKENFVLTFESYKVEAHNRQEDNEGITDSLLLVTDAYLDTFIELVEADKYRELLDRLEDQYDVIRSLPGNSVTNEFNLSVVYRDLYRKFCKTEKEFLEKSMRVVESLKNHIQVLVLADSVNPRPDHYGVQEGDLEMVTENLEEAKRMLKELENNKP